MSHGSVCSWWGTTLSTHHVFTARLKTLVQSARRLFHKRAITNIVFKEAHRMKRLLLPATCRWSKLTIAFFPLHIHLCRCQWFCQQTEHHKSKKTEFHSSFPTRKTPQSRNLQRFQLLLQVCHPVSKDPAGAHMSRCLVFWGGRSVCKRSYDRDATCWCASGAG